MRPATVRPEERPAGYPLELERALHLTDGRTVQVRPIVPGDAPALRSAAEVADADTLYGRFFTASPNLGSARVRYLTEVDYRHRLALVALDSEGEGIAIARYEGAADRPDAEVAVVVDPGFRRVGLAGALLGMLEERARACGIELLTAVYLTENDAAERMLAGAGFGGAAADSGVTTVAKRLARPELT